MLYNNTIDLEGFKMTNFVEYSMHKLTESGLKYTKRRADLLAVFDTDDTRFISAKMVQKRIAETYPSMSFDTIYRNLKLFTEHEFLEESEVNGEMTFRKHCNPNMGHHHHFICQNCGKTAPLKMCPLDFFEAQLPGYDINDHIFELQGICASCKIA